MQKRGGSFAGRHHFGGAQPRLELRHVRDDRLKSRQQLVRDRGAGFAPEHGSQFRFLVECDAVVDPKESRRSAQEVAALAIRVVGDRFVFESEVLFPSGQATMTPEGLGAMDQLAQAIIELSHQIPREIDWTLQVDGHTDIRPINSPQFPSNWELSTARAVSVVKYLISRGVPAKRLVAAGHGEFSPLETGNDEESLRKNRRIELKLTSR